MNSIQLRKYRREKIKQKSKVLKKLTGKTQEESILLGLDILLYFRTNIYTNKSIGEKYEKVTNAIDNNNNGNNSL